ncbi:hypothetical protein L2Z53_11890 (plasmid) [Macrococcoides canis]|nr:hypothetical protein [Macrococcus canis]UJS29036.1 hypothetical protein L2Z53_11890 [Macrococcus canis]
MSDLSTKNTRKPKFNVAKLKQESVSTKVKNDKIILNKDNPRELEWYFG